MPSSRLRVVEKPADFAAQSVVLSGSERDLVIRMAKRLAACAVMISLCATSALAEPVRLPDDAPLPTARPSADGPTPSLGPEKEVEQASLAPAPAAAVTKQSREDAPEGDASRALRAGLGALADGDIGEARASRDSLPADTLDRHILVWAIALSGNPTVPSAEIAQAARDLPGWPGMARLRANSERALYREKPSPKAVIDAFDGAPPQTYQGMLALARAYVDLGDRQTAGAVLAPFWSRETLEPGQEVSMIREFGKLIPKAAHCRRLERMLYVDRIRSAERVQGFCGRQTLVKAWAAVIRGQREAGKLLDAVPKAQRTAGYFYAKARFLRRDGQFHNAAEAMLAAPTDPEKTIDADAWWTERRVLSRELLDLGDAKTAYRIAAAHEGGGPASAADAAFHAGWYALRGMHDPKAAARHFKRITEVAKGAISLSRAYYWLGRAAAAGGPGTAVAYYERAARYGTAFYGQVAAAKLGRDTIPAAPPRITSTDRMRFKAREVVRAIERLEEAGYGWRANILYRDLAEELESTGELALLAAMAEERDNHYLALRIGKTAAQRGVDIGALAHPLGAIPPSADISSAGKALAYAVARQESEFNTGAVSGAGARGLLQLMPATARQMARENGLPYSATRLTSDPGYNAILGSTYLGEQLGRFNGSYVLTFAGYNAGPSRARQWVERYGDPRGADIDAVIDWIERIPYSETRNYVQRVMENYQVYKMRLEGHFDIVGDLVEGR